MEKFVNKLKNSAPVLLVLLLLFLVSSSITFYNGWVLGIDLYHKHFRHEEVLLDKISRLAADTNIGYFKEILGPPVFVNATIENAPARLLPEGYREYIFIDELFYVQAVTDNFERILIFSVTTRSEDFNPTLSLGPFTSNKEAPFSIKLGKTRFYELDDNPQHIYSVTGANRFFYSESYYYGNPGNYQTYIFGLNDAGVRGIEYEAEGRGTGFLLPPTINPDGSASLEDELIKEFRGGAIVNTYSVTSPFFQFQGQEEFLKTFVPGPNHSQVRILPRAQ